VSTKFVESIVEGFDIFMAWLSASIKQTTEAYIDIETADSRHALVAHDGSLVSVVRVFGVKALVGSEEFRKIVDGLSNSLRTSMGQPGFALQVYFHQDQDGVGVQIDDIYGPASATSKKLELDLDDLFTERKDYISRYCAAERVFFVFWTRPSSMTKEQTSTSIKDKAAYKAKHELPNFNTTQNVLAAIPTLRDAHDAFVRSVLNDFNTLNIHAELLDVHSAIYDMRMTADPDFTSRKWRATLPGDKIVPKEVNHFKGEASDLLWPSLAQQILPRDAEDIDRRTCRIGDRVYSSLFIDLFPKDIKSFVHLFSRTLAAQIPWRISFLIESEGLEALKLKKTLSGILSFSSAQNRLINDSVDLLNYIDINTDDSVVRLRVTATTWAPEDDVKLLRTRVSELAKAIQGWGSCEVAEYCGDPFHGIVSSIMGVTTNSAANPSVAPLSDVVYMLPVTRPASQWLTGALLFRTPDGKLWPFQPGSPLQTTWIDLIYARPGSGKSVLSNAINLALCLSGGMQRLPRIAVIDIGPSSAGLISLVRESLPPRSRHLVAHYRLRMTPEFSVNPFDTQLGCRYPNPSERAFLVNFMTLLVTPLGADRPYDAIPDLAGMVVDELFKQMADDGKPQIYAEGIEPLIDGLLEEIGFVKDMKTTWWEVVDALFAAGFINEAYRTQRYTSPLLADAASICRSPAIEDLYGKISTPTGESLIDAFGRMVSSSIREYPILSRVTQFDIGDARVVALDLDEVAKSGGDAADRQTAVMYMLARYILAKSYYLTEDNVTDMAAQYQDYHRARIGEIRDDPKRIVYDEFHRTSKSRSVREQVILDMREGRKWKVQIALLSQSVDDFDKNMIEFATAVYIMDAGPASAVKKTTEIFGLSETAQTALSTRVHGPRAGGATFLAQFATKVGVNTQLLTLTLGPIELWAFSTTADDANLRNKLYKAMGPAEARRLLATIFPGGTCTTLIEERLTNMRDESGGGIITEDDKRGAVDKLLEEILDAYAENPKLKSLPKVRSR
jgi:intracellular multiplication protein IcmB